MARPLRVLLTLPQLDMGGVETHTLALAQGLKQRGHEVTVLSGGGALTPRLEALGVEHITLPVHRKNLFTMLALVPAIRRLVRERGFQVVHAHSRVPAWIGFLATRGLPRVAFVVTAHGHYNAHLGSRVVREGQRVIAISHSVRDHVVRNLGVSAGRVDVVYNGLDLAQFAHAVPGPLREQLTAEGFLPPGGFLVGNLGRLSKLKGLDTLLEAAAWLKQHQPAAPIRFVLIGEGPERRHLLHRMAELGLEDRVRLLDGVVDARPAVKAMDLFALPSISEGLGLAALEAMLMGVPVVACRVPGLMELVDESVGCLVEPRDGVAFAGAVLALSQNAPRREHLAALAVEKATRLFSLEAMAAGTEAVYRRALAEARLAHDKLHVLQLIPELKMGGNERGVVDLSRWLVQQGHAVTVVSHGGRLVEEIELAGARHVVLNVHSKSPWIALRAVWPLVRLMRERAVHVVDAHSRVPAWVAWLACKFERRVAFVTTAHGDYRAHVGSRVMAWGDRVIAVSGMIAQKMRREFRVPEHRLRQVHRWVDFEQFDPAITPPAGLRAQLGNPARLVGILGRITHWKGHAVLLEAAALLHRQGFVVDVAVVGEASPGKENLAAALREQARRLGLEKHVHFVGFRADVPAVVRELDVVAHCSTDPEPFGRVLLEAMAMGTPVIGASGGAVNDIIQDKQNGRLTPPGDAPALAEAIRWFLEDPARARQVADFASVDVRRRFDLGAMAAQTLAVYYEALSPQAPPLSPAAATGEPLSPVLPAPQAQAVPG